MARAFHQALRANRIEKARRRAVIKHGGRRGRFIAQLNLNRMSLIGTNAQAVVTERKTLFVIRLNDVFELRARQRLAVLLQGGEQFINGDPALCVELQTDLLRFVPQDQAEKSAHFYYVHNGSFRQLAREFQHAQFFFCA